MPAACETRGSTKVLACCEFVWREVDQQRFVELCPEHHDRCIEELRKLLVQMGVGLVFVMGKVA